MLCLKGGYMRSTFIMLLALTLTACASGYQQFYKPYVETKTLTDVQVLNPGEEPRVFGTSDFDRDIKILRSKMYIPVGYSSFNGQYEDESKVKDQAKKVGAIIVLVKSQYTNTQTTTSPLFIPNSSTTYQSGSVYGGGVSGGYSGTSTTTGTTVVPITTQQRRYDQTAVFFVKSTKKPKIGIIIKNLNDEQRQAIERNTGAVIEIVIEGSPAFYSNVLAGDILIKVNGVDVRDTQHALNLMRDLDANAGRIIFTVIRNGKEKEIQIELKKT
jgi:serine protease Do